ncbi:MAG: methyltransferase [Alphaproteobacteria bacterium]|nr:methyltransferase [Alphaproteobacteria bacterium]
MNKNYIDVVYNDINRPLTDYPSKLSSFLYKKYNLKKGDKFLEVGCGRGEFLKGFIDLGIDGYGVDQTDNAKKICVNSEIKIADLEKELLPYDDNFFDIIYSKSVVEHFYYPEKLFKEMHRVLKPGGILLTLTPDWENTYKIFYEDYTHRTPFTYNSLKDIQSIVGFTEIKVQKFIQLPILWENKIHVWLLKILSFLTNTILVPERLKIFKWVKFSKEIMLLSSSKKKLL